MEITTKHIGLTIVEIEVKSNGNVFSEDVCDINGFVSAEFIDELEDVVRALKEHNLETNFKRK